MGAEISWPAGYSGLEYRDGDYRYPAQPGAQPYAEPPASAGPSGEHPYAAFGGSEYNPSEYNSGGYSQPNIDAFGYGDPGYSDPGYDGPSAQDAGIAGTHTVRGTVESSSSYAHGAYHGGSGPLEVQYGDPSADFSGNGSSIYQQPWDYEQPLRYEGEEVAYPLLDRSDQQTYIPPSYDTGYQGSEYPVSGVNGHDYDLSGIIGTGEFPEIGYDQPSYDRLSYDDPRYDNGSRFGQSRVDTPGFGIPMFGDPAQGSTTGSNTRFDLPVVRDEPRQSETRFDIPAIEAPGGYNAQGLDSFRGDQTRFDMPAVDDFDAARLDHVWPAREDVQDNSPRFADAYDTGPMNQTRFDMPSLDGGADMDSFDAFGTANRSPKTSVDGLRALAPSTEFRPAGTGGLLAVPDEQPMNWANETSFDTYGDLDAQELPTGFTRAPERSEVAEDAEVRRAATGKRRGRSSDKKQWLALGAIGIVAAGAISFVMMKTFSGPGGPAHTVAAPTKVESYTRQPALEKQMKVDQLRDTIIKQGNGQLSDAASAVYQQGSSAPGSNPQIFMFVGGKVSNSDPSASVADVEKTYHAAQAVPPGSLGGKAACGTATVNGESVAMCVWFDNDTFGEMVSPTMSPSQLATTMGSVRPDLEHLAQ
jgi:hypothetical protein